VDVVVYGGTAGGVIAAVAAAREGKSVLLIEPGKHLGGMVSGGLGATDTGNRSAIGGYSKEFFDRVREYYVRQYGPDSQQVKDCSNGFHFEPHVAEQVFQDMINEAKVKVLFDQWALVTVARTGPHIDFIVTNSRNTFIYPKSIAKVFIDASYEGDLLAKAKVGYTIGRESREQFNESIAGVQAHSPAHQWSVKLSPFEDGAKLLPFVQNGPAGETGAGDKKVQAYNYRLCMTDRKENQVPFPKPPHYDPSRYELLARYLAKKPDLNVGQLMNPVRLPNGKTDTNNNGPFSTDYIGASWTYAENDGERTNITRDHVEYVQGFLYFLANDPRVPPALHEEMNRWGLAKDEFADNANWPYQLYVREARRMIGEYFMTQADMMERRTKDDSIGLGSYNTDSHHVQRVVGPDGFVLNEGDFQVHVQPYAIPYRSLVPKKGECDNLLVPVCMSASHVAYGTIRMEPVYMILGQASGVAAALAVDAKISVQEVSIAQLQAKLKAQKAVVSPEGLADASPGGMRIDPKQLTGVVVDDPQAAKTGAWVHSAAIGPFVGDGYLHDNNQAKGQMRIRFTPDLPKDGRYEVQLFYTANPNRATNVPIIVHHADGEKSIRVNQRRSVGSEQSLQLGVFNFASGAKGWVEIRNDETDGYVVADAVQFVPAK
jgi:hypothetical protein